MYTHDTNTIATLANINIIILIYNIPLHRLHMVAKITPNPPSDAAFFVNYLRSERRCALFTPIPLPK